MTSKLSAETVAVEYADEDDVAERLGELIVAGVPMRITLHSGYRDLLAPHIVGGHLVNPAHIGTIPPLQTFLAAVMLAEGAERTIEYSIGDDSIIVNICGRELIQA